MTSHNQFLLTLGLAPLTENLALVLWQGDFRALRLPAAFGLLAGYLSLRYRLKGPYFSLVTLALAEMLRVVAVNTKAVGSSLGLVVPSARPAPGMFKRLGTTVLLVGQNTRQALGLSRRGYVLENEAHRTRGQRRRAPRQRALRRAYLGM